MAIYMWREYVVPADALYFEANTAGSTIQLNKNGSPTEVSLEISTNYAEWTDYTIGDTITLTNIGDRIYMRNKNTTTTGFSISTGKYYKFSMSGSINGNGDINYLLNKNSTTTLSNYCYIWLFQSCSSLKTAPDLPATTLADYCYYAMFEGTGITTAPALPALTVAPNCYIQLFKDCTSLVNPPALPATTLASYCYMSLFQGCTSLEKIHNLPVLSLPGNCYNSMYNGCTKIKVSSTKTGSYNKNYRIPQTGTGSLQTNALKNMFYGTGGTFAGTPSINTTYYTSNQVI